MKDFKSSDELIARMIALGLGEIEPQDEFDEEILAEYNEIIEAGGEIAIPNDLPDPVKGKKPKKAKVKSFLVAPEEKVAVIDGDNDGLCFEDDVPVPCPPEVLRRGSRNARRTQRQMRRMQQSRIGGKRRGRLSSIDDIADDRAKLRSLKKQSARKEKIEARLEMRRAVDKDRSRSGIRKLKRDKYQYLEAERPESVTRMMEDVDVYEMIRDRKDVKSLFIGPEGDYSPERLAQQDAKIEAIISPQGLTPPTKPVGERRIWMLGGGPGSGKTYMKRTGIIDYPERGTESVHIDADEIKSLDPDYETWVRQGVSQAAGLAHTESGDIAARALDRATSEGYDIVLDGTGDGATGTIERRVAMLRERGYKISARYTVTSIEESRARALERQKLTGRAVPEVALHDTHVEIARALPIFMEDGLFDDVEVWDNNDEEPKLIAMAQGKNVSIIDREKWNSFVLNGSRLFMEAPEDERGREPKIKALAGQSSRIHVEDINTMIVGATLQKEFDELKLMNGSKIAKKTYEAIKKQAADYVDDSILIEPLSEMSGDYNFMMDSISGKSANQDIYPLNDRQEDLYDGLESLVEEHGVFDRGIGANGAHYVDAEKNPFKEEGMVCSNCAFYVGPRGCELVRGDIDPNAICKFWVIPENLLVVKDKPEAEKSLISSSIHRSNKPKGKRKRYLERVRDNGSKWQKLIERGVLGIETLPTGGLVSGKAIVRFIPRSTDPDTYTDPTSARIRSRQIGCIGIRRYTTRNGETVWMPCTTHVTYQRETGQGAYRGQMGRQQEANVRRLVRREITRSQKSPTPDNQVDSEKSAKQRKARSDRLAATPAPKGDRISGSSRNRIGSAASTSAASSIEINEATVEALRQKVKDHNAKVHGTGGWKRTSLGALKAVYRRGAGAFSSSHRPGMTRGQWAMGRVNAFLKMLEKGKPDNPRYTGDNDLLPEDHPWRKK